MWFDSVVKESLIIDASGKCYEATIQQESKLQYLIRSLLYERITDKIRG